MTATQEQIGTLLDELYLEMLDLIEQQVLCRVNIEKLSNSGQLLLAKTRFLQGSHTVGMAQIPTENSADFKALCRIEDSANTERISTKEYTLQRHSVNKADGYVEPLHWFFGALVPGSLRTASQQFQKCVEIAVESANVQRELLAVMQRIEQLKKTTNIAT